MKRKVIGCQSRGCHIRCFSVISAHPPPGSRARQAGSTHPVTETRYVDEGGHVGSPEHRIDTRRAPKYGE